MVTGSKDASGPMILFIPVSRYELSRKKMVIVSCKKLKRKLDESSSMSLGAKTADEWR